MTNRPSDEELGEQFQAAMEEWKASEDSELWESTIGDGIEPDPVWDRLPPIQNDQSGGASRRR
jgi:hypothetical protein